jgi:hypothetical protein
MKKSSTLILDGQNLFHWIAVAFAMMTTEMIASGAQEMKNATSSE